MPSKTAAALAKKRDGAAPPAALRTTLLLLILDYSGSMGDAYTPPEGGKAITRLRGLIDGCHEGMKRIAANPALVGVEVGTVRFASTAQFLGWRRPSELVLPDDGWSGSTDMAGGLAEAYAHYIDRCGEANDAGEKLTTTTVLLVSDGQPDSNPNAAMKPILDLAAAGKMTLIGAGLTETDRQLVEKLGMKTTCNLSEVSWSEIFELVTKSISCAAAGQGFDALSGNATGSIWG